MRSSRSKVGNPGTPTAAEAGIALLSVLWVSVLLAVLVGGIQAVAHFEGRAAQGAAVRAELDAAIEAGLNLASVEISRRAGRRGEKLAEVLEYEIGSIAVTVVVKDEAGRIDLNAAPETLIREYLVYMGVNDGLAERIGAAILDWRDRDDLRRLKGAEAADYRAAGLGYQPRNGPFLNVHELRQVYGMTPDIYSKVSGGFTTATQSRGVDLAAASVEMVSFFLNGDLEAANNFIQGRNAGGAAVPYGVVRGDLRRHTTRSQKRLFRLTVEASKGEAVNRREFIIEVEAADSRGFRVVAMQ